MFEHKYKEYYIW